MRSARDGLDHVPVLGDLPIGEPPDVHDRQADNSGDPEPASLHAEMVSYGSDAQAPPPDPAEIALTIRLDHAGAELRLLSTVATFGAAFDVALDDIAVEAYLPADDETARMFRIAGEDAAGAGPSGWPSL